MTDKYICYVCEKQIEVCLAPFFILKYLDYEDQGVPYESLKHYIPKSYEISLCSLECLQKEVVK